jgi:translocation and assembly module TamA
MRLVAQQATVSAPGAPEDLVDDLRAASLILATLAEAADTGTAVPPADLIASARADYGRILGALYSDARYSGVVSIRADGREVADIAPFSTPSAIGQITITVEPGPRFAFSRAEVAPLADGTELPQDFAPAQPARSDLIQQAARAGIVGWRDAGHALADLSGQQVTADHAANLLSARIALDPGPRLRFGPVAIQGNTRVRTERVAAIAGVPEGEEFSPMALRRSAERLRRTGTFRVATLTEGDAPVPGTDLLPIGITVEEEAPRRLGFGAELSTAEGLVLSGFWLHRNLLGGAERLRLEASVSGLGGETGGEDYDLTAAFARPATFTPDTTLTATARIARLQEPDYDEDTVEFGVGLDRWFSDRLSGTAALEYRASEVSDSLGRRVFHTVSLPLGVTWDRRDDIAEPAAGFYLSAEAQPFVGFEGAGSGVRLTADARAYRGLGERVVLAGRLQFGSVYGPTLLETPRDYLFYSGGGGTVRGQDYQALGVNVLRSGLQDQRTGGQHFIGLQTEARIRVRGSIGAVAFLDAGYVAATDWGQADGWHAGAGLGVRYQTGIGPIRADIGLPVGGSTGADSSGVQVYIGVGHAF